ncbi:hypothetical protein [Polymorphobacter fuscus]|uniref:Uncharacterized protein n=1 Tax=Sandarakinorhabdus fusca TaxID=1439888 RepID=A0A7C9KY20_9SPHN|nr:hypothetical protein [Polymorphobacter fuscus]KAB7648845.1 hypothetical protein F9290_04045 [Polymorphobacter fuscus]MQT16428.1 hypothetical protein [Polymorphobacter fuscus]NJC07282.1 hypothetical protein [Polymorphobacter fuscus]
MTDRSRLAIHIDTETQLFNSMDPAPFRRRELDSAVVDYIIAFAEKAPSGVPLTLAIHIDAAAPGIDVAANVADAVCENFRRMAAAKRRQLRRLFHDGRISLVIGIAFVALSVAIGEALAGYAQVISESFVIGSWVALWHPINIFLFDWWPLRREARLYDRLSETTVQIIGP